VGISGEAADGVDMGTGAGLKEARIRLRLGADLRVDEFPNDIVCLGLLADLSPHVAFGVDARYAHMLGKHFEINIGGIGYLVPSTLLGPSADVKYHLALSKSAELVFGPELNLFVLGKDLPGDTLFVEALLQAGVRTSF
jgi:hypothetical protein